MTRQFNLRRIGVAAIPGVMRVIKIHPKEERFPYGLLIEELLHDRTCLRAVCRPIDEVDPSFPGQSLVPREDLTVDRSRPSVAVEMKIAAAHTGEIPALIPEQLRESNNLGW